MFADEPKVPEELLTMDNVVVLPHVGSGTVQTRAAMEALTLRNLESFLASGELVTPVPCRRPASGVGPVELPQTLHSQLYLLAYDRKRRRFRFDQDNSWSIRWLFGFALRAAMLTDLYLSGYVGDREGKAHRLKTAGHPDPVLEQALDGVSGQEWTKLIASDGRDARGVVHDQLEAAGWILGRRRRTFGILPAARHGLYDEDMVSGLADRVTGALENILDDRPADPRPLALGLIAVQAQMPVVFSFVKNSRQRDVLREMTLAAIEPILGLHQATHNQFSDYPSGGGWGAGGCGGGI